ncbi:cyclin-B1-2-like [Dioscorea cayenensis subsp. rotundata]|uniref:Cyclin-B1-2-like n=1 Tax=Dioscorea cayennensis subsp. rotundata TaxID=55577 RepID=A0AB40ATT2_DIOCR|nr:cyclin-B1-2-like [Dioscorea cayenensis subsp. rotundata]
MASKRITHDVVGGHDALRFGLDGVKGDIVGVHPLQSLREKMKLDLEGKKRSILDLTYGSAFNLRNDFERQILSRFQKPPGVLPSSMLGYEALTGCLEDFGFEDYLNVPQDSETHRPAEMHHGMEVCHGLSKGPVCPSLN